MSSSAARAQAPATGTRLDAVFKALASAQRREILRLIAEESGDQGKTCCEPHEVCGCKLAERLGLVASTISHHMAVLREAGLVHSRKEGQWVYYSLDRAQLDEAAESLKSL